ncbi:MAG: DUF167 domain-containing protein [Actinomycetia bacterium]|nr:DUF167 domain-containing protein [Actinomycetes bacterium]
MRTDIIRIYVRPNSSETKIAGLYNNNIKIKIESSPEKGKANKELVNFISRIIGIPKSRIEIISGITSNYKTIRIDDRSNTDYSKIILSSSESDL